LAVKPPSFDAFRQQANVLQNREKTARLLRLFSPPRKRLGLTPDGLLIFFAIGYLGTRVADDAIQVTPIGIMDVSSLDPQGDGPSQDRAAGRSRPCREHREGPARQRAHHLVSDAEARRLMIRCGRHDGCFVHIGR
jgi:hypothetical protein